MDVLPRLGRWIATLAGAGLLASLFADWYGQQIFCILAPCPQPGVSGWEALSGDDLLLAVAAALGPLPLLLGLVWRPAARVSAAVALLGGLLAALLVVHRISVVPEAPGLDEVSVRLVGRSSPWPQRWLWPTAECSRPRVIVCSSAGEPPYL
ncbi:MAG: hypothetical protein MSC31_06700 [Solirubrobacteraceae bacterium MAG38_C4-C5]|nr:hypothetical protein [Candidatus Siliceabacter maunaloa]